jgi:hypothetical protein
MSSFGKTKRIKLKKISKEKEVLSSFYDTLCVLPGHYVFGSLSSSKLYTSLDSWRTWHLPTPIRKL